MKRVKKAAAVRIRAAGRGPEEPTRSHALVQAGSEFAASRLRKAPCRGEVAASRNVATVRRPRQPARHGGAAMPGARAPRGRRGVRHRAAERAASITGARSRSEADAAADEE